jgi:RecA/RadA recombinase
MAIDLNKVARSLKRNYGSTGVLAGSDEDEGYKDFVSTGNKAFDLVLDGGIPFGHLTEFVGFSQSGKSLFAQMILGNAQKEFDAVGVVVDRENAFTEKRANQLGINTENVIKAPAKDVQLVTDAFTFIIDTIDLIRKQDQEQYIVVVIDSIAAFDKDVSLEKADAGRKQKATKEGLRKLLGFMDSKVMCIVVNQFYYAIGQMYGDPRIAGGGEGLRYFNSIRVGLEDKKHIVNIKRDNEVIGSWIGIDVLKTRMGPCYRKCMVPFYYETGIPFLGGYGRLLAHRNYLYPRNKQEFKSFKQSTLIYERDEIKKELNEHRLDAFLSEHEELIFEEYPEWYEGEEEVKDTSIVEVS